MRKYGIAALAGLLTATAAWADGFEEMQSQVKEFTLDNGLKFLVVERPDSPVFSFTTYVDAGGVDEVHGVTGIAHMFEHMAFKGTPTIGTKDHAAEMKALEKVDAAWAAYEKELDKEYDADAIKLDELMAAFKAAQKEAQEFVVSNEFTKILEKNGVQGLNASTGLDRTWYYYSLPSNRLELWARLEGDRMTNPVLREFYVERDVVIEERRFGESSPTGRLFEDMITGAFVAHPYGTGVIGYAADLERITRQDAWEFFDKHYVASNMNVVVVGDIKVGEVRKLAEKYFSGVRSGEDPLRVRTTEPEHKTQIRMIREEDSQPIYAVGWHIPGRNHPKWYAYELLGDVMATGRSSRMYTRLVKEDQVCSQIFGGVGFPGNKYPNMMVLAGFASSDSDPYQVESVVLEEIKRIVTEGITEEELEKVKTMNKAAFVRSVRSNQGLANQLALYQGMLGDWRRLFRSLDDLESITVEDVQEAARAVLKKENSVVAMIVKPEDAES